MPSFRRRPSLGAWVLLGVATTLTACSWNDAWRDGSTGLDVSDSQVLAEFGDSGPQLAVAPNPGHDGTAGSGCVVDDEMSLPDGVWAVYLTAARDGAAHVTLLCYSTVESGGATYDFDWERTDYLRSVPWASGAALHLQTNPPVRSVSEDSDWVSLSINDLSKVESYLAEVPEVFGWLLVQEGQITEFYSPDLASA